MISLSNSYLYHISKSENTSTVSKKPVSIPTVSPTTAMSAQTHLKNHTVISLTASPKADLSTLFKHELSEYEVVFLCEILSDAECANLLKGATLENKPIILEKLQTLLNEKITFKETFKIAFHDLMNIYQKSTRLELIKKIALYLVDLFTCPLQILYKAIQLIVFKKDREVFIQKLKSLCSNKSLTYENRKKITRFLLNFGISGILGTAISAIILSGGVATLPLIVFGSIAAASLTAKIANDRLANKSPYITIGELTRDVTQVSLESFAFAPLAFIGTAHKLAKPMNNLVTSSYDFGNVAIVTTEIAEAAHA